MPTSSEPVRCLAQYFDGVSAKRIFAEVTAMPSGLTIALPDVMLFWPRGGIVVEPAAGAGCDRILRRTDGSSARLRVAAGELARLGPAIGRPHLRFRLRELSRYLAAVGMLCLGAGAVFAWLLPTLISEASGMRSVQQEVRESERRFERFVERNKRRSSGRLEYCVHQPGRDALERLVGTLVQDASLTFEPRIIVISSLIDNAYSLSGGYVVLTSTMLDELKNQTELAGIIAHEIGHNEQRHHTRFEMEAAAWLAVMGGLFNTPLTNWNYLLTGTRSGPALRSREMEREADRFAVAMLARARMDPGALGHYMARNSGLEGDVAFFSSSHPSYAERAAFFAAARQRGREVLSPEEWREVRAICRRRTEKAPAFLQGPDEVQQN
ncbi:MAG TPA: M48 family metallopeptidase [Ferrovibrio sp.]|uniref:M48 family metallopeptidase n=1 Tax=Ferrovibrio sp. TaxID=1917215 RepID=UPI002B4B6D31|nr:M48 family metallopeptidase [Ferrovibrio sp.]HLT79015.1 M48 family metallopeptidase [Ferrovibrio sp.]